MDQTDRPKGRGRGRGKSSAPPKRPNPEAVAEASESADSPGTDQFTDAPPNQSSSAQVSTHDPDPKTSDGKGNIPPLVQDLKDALRQGAKIETSPRLDPQSPEFSPSLTAVKVKTTPFPVMNGPSSNSDLAPVHHTRPVMNKMQPFSTSPLNARAAEFVPNFSQQTVEQNGMEPFCADPPDERPSFGPADIVKGFNPVSEIADLESEPIITSAAEMLVKATLYVGSFDHLRVKLEQTLKISTLSKGIYENLAEMLIHWGVLEPYFCYTSCKMCEVIAVADHNFLYVLVHRMQEWYKKESGTLNTSETIGIINYSLFFAELFTRLRLGERPIEILASNIFNLVDMLLDLKTNNTVIGACNILKLTGALLDECEKTDKMSQVVKQLKELSTDKSKSFTKSCIELLVLVVELHGRKWTEKKEKSLPKETVKKSKLNVDAAPFVPTSFLIEQPVLNVAEWGDFETDYSDLGEVADGVAYECPDGDDGLDPDIELEMEAFIDAIEEHLLMQDFDPEIEHK